MTKKATEQALSSLHGALANTFTDILQNGEAVVDKQTGEAMRVTPGAATLNAIRQFLKDNSITSSPTHDPNLQGLQSAAAATPNFEPDEFGLAN